MANQSSNNFVSGAPSTNVTVSPSVCQPVVPCKHRNGPALLLGEFEQMMLFRMILDKPGIYLSEIQDELMCIFGVLHMHLDYVQDS